MVKSFFIFAAVRRQAGEDHTGGAVRPATACAACGVHAAGVNQLNRIKLMLSTAQKKLKK